MGDSTTASSWIDLWGDGKIMISNPPSTLWDDGNTSDGDGCSSSCEVETDWTCSGGNSTTASICEKWGDGIVILNSVSSDYCDDGNSKDSDGCSSSWAVEVGYTCSLATATTAWYL